MDSNNYIEKQIFKAIQVLIQDGFTIEEIEQDFNEAVENVDHFIAVRKDRQPWWMGE